MTSRKRGSNDEVNESLVLGYWLNLRGCSKIGDAGRYSGMYREKVLQTLKQENPQLHAAVLKRLGEKE